MLEPKVFKFFKINIFIYLKFLKFLKFQYFLNYNVVYTLKSDKKLN